EHRRASVHGGESQQARRQRRLDGGGKLRLLTLTSVTVRALGRAEGTKKIPRVRRAPAGGRQGDTVGQAIVIGLDVGSTTVKAVVVDPDTKAILWSDYKRHHTKQPECVLDFMLRIGQAFADVDPGDVRLFITGSGGGPLEGPLGAKF